MSQEVEAPRPGPEPSTIARPYFEAAKQRKLVIQQNKDKGNYLFYSHYFDPEHPEDELEWVEASGRGKIHTFSIVRQHPHPYFANRVPYVYAVIELEEGTRLISNVITDDVESVKCEMPVIVDFEDLDDEFALPVFRLA